MNGLKHVSLKDAKNLPRVEQRKRIESLLKSEAWEELMVVVDECMQRFEDLGSGDTSIERFFIELHEATGTPVNQLESMPTSKLEAYADAILRKRGSTCEIIDTADARKMMGTKSNATLQRAVKKAGVTSVRRGQWLLSDIVKAKTLRDTKKLKL